MAAQRLVRHLLLVPIPEEDLLAGLDEEPTQWPDEVQRGTRIQGVPSHVVCDVGDLLAREKLPRLGAGGSPLSVV